MMRLNFVVPFFCFIATINNAVIADTFQQVTVNRYATTERSYATNAYWLESPDTIVLIDALMVRKTTDAAPQPSLPNGSI